MCRKSRAVCMRTIILDGTTQLSFLGSTRQSRRRFHYFICTFTGMTVKTWNGLYRMSRLGLIAAIPGKGLTNGLLLRRAVEYVTVTREDECLTSNKAYSFFPPPPPFRARRYGWDMRNDRISVHVEARREKKWTLNYTQANWWTVIDAIRSKLSDSFVPDIIEWLISSGL